MKTIPASLRRAGIAALLSASVAVVVVLVDQVPPSGGLTTAASTTIAAPPTPQDTSTTTTSATTSTSTTTTALISPASGLIQGGPSRIECLEPNFIDTGLASLQSAVTSFETTTKSTVTCVSAYLNSAPNWTAWVHPWITNPRYGYSAWVAKQPKSRQLILAIDLIPTNLKNVNNPIKWEQSCAAGDFNSHAKQLGTSLVAGGLENSVVRLGAEMNGIWEDDFIGTTTAEQHLWAKCFANEATGLRKASGEHFLIDWNPNACKMNIKYSKFYPGNAYVDIVGLDLFDIGCDSPKTPLSFSQLSHEPAGLSHFEKFAAAKGKPMSLPEWGLSPNPIGDDPAYIVGIGSTVKKKDFAFESYFDTNVFIRPYLPLGNRTPLSLAAYKKWFGDSQ